MEQLAETDIDGESPDEEEARSQKLLRSPSKELPNYDAEWKVVRAMLLISLSHDTL